MIVSAFLGLTTLSTVFLIGRPEVPYSGGSIGAALGMALAALPVLAYAAIRHPLVMPYALWVALVPFEDIFATRGASLEKYLAILCGLTALVHVLVKRTAIRPPRATLAFLAFILFAIFSLAWTMDVEYAVFLIKQIVGLFLAMVLIALVPATRRDLAIIFSAAVVGGAMMGIYTMQHTSHFSSASLDPRAWVGSDPNFASATFLVPAVIALGGAIAVSKPAIRIACIIALLAMMVGLLQLASRGAFVSLGVGLTYLFVRMRRRGLLLAIALLASSSLLVFPTVLSRFTDPRLAGGSGRDVIWRIAQAAFNHHPVIGNGFGSFVPAYATSFLEVYAPGAAPIQNSHNIFVQIGVELGVIGIALLAYALFEQMRTLRIIPPSDGKWYDLRIIMEAVTLTVFVDCLTLDLLPFKVFWLCVGLTWVMRSAYVAEHRQPVAIRDVPP